MNPPSKSWTHENPGCRFEACKFYNPDTNHRGCKFFRWVDEEMTNWQRDALNLILSDKQLLKGEVIVLQTRLCCVENEKKRLKEEVDKLKLKLKKRRIEHGDNFGMTMVVCVVMSMLLSLFMVKLVA
uniref:Uncharacterized protein n=1 Tax=Chenopodium quinoa TaxID=63459 RepID=A0A803N608_CHEQI